MSKELNKAPVEQAGGDEREEFEAWMHTFDLPPQLDGETFADERYLEAACFGQFVYDDPLTQRCWAAWQARAALAQPSPVSEALIYACKNLAQITSSDGSGHADIAMAILRMAGVGDDERERLVNEWKAARAWKPAPAQAEKAEVVAYADPIAFATFKKRGSEGGVAGREWMWAEPSAGLVAMSRTDECECIVGELRADRDSWAKRWDEAVRYGARIEEQRDAALARVAELETKLAELETQEPAGWLAYYVGGKRNGRIYGSPCNTKEEIDRYIQQVERSDDSISLQGKPFYATPVAQAQHSVPEGWNLCHRTMAKHYPLEVQSVGSDTYIAMSKGHHDLEVFMAEAVKECPDWFLGGPQHKWCKTVPDRSGEFAHRYVFVDEGTRGAWPATYCWEFGEDWKRWNGMSEQEGSCFTT